MIGMKVRCFTLLSMIAITFFKYVSLDRTGVEYAGGLCWHGEWYLPYKSLRAYDLLGRTKDGGYIYSYKKGDKTLNYVTVRSFMDENSYIKQKYLMALERPVKKIHGYSLGNNQCQSGG